MKGKESPCPSRQRAGSNCESDALKCRKHSRVQEFGYMAVCKLMAKSIK